MRLPAEIFLRASRDALGVRTVVLVYAFLRLCLGNVALLVGRLRNLRRKLAPRMGSVLEEEISAWPKDLGVVLLLRVESGIYRKDEERPEIMDVYVVPLRRALARHDRRKAVLERELGHVIGLDTALVHGSPAWAVD